MTYAELPGKAGAIDLYLPVDAGHGKPVPVVWVSGGCAWLCDDGNTIGPRYAEQFVPHGFAVAAVSVRSSGQAVFPAQLHDAKASVRWLRAHADRYHLDKNRIAAMGDSSGAFASTMLGVTGNDPELEGDVGVTGPSSAVNAVVDLYTPTQFAEMDQHNLPGSCELINEYGGGTNCHDDAKSPEGRLIGCRPSTCPDEVRAASPLTYVDTRTPPFLVVHGDADINVPWQQSQLLFDAVAAHRVPATFYRMHGMEHDMSFLDRTDGGFEHTVHTSSRNGEVVHMESAPPLNWAEVISWLDGALRVPTDG
ncbi:choline esterase [Pseudonocardia sp. MH-G8]|nr:choline esterase [Pseudonocardia sp. MH-G8]